MPLQKAPATQFDAAYYQRHYENRRTRAVAPADTARLAGFVLAYMNYLQLPVRRVLDVGCGLGLWQAPVRAQHPRVFYRGVEYSPYLCEKYGWVQDSADTYIDNKTYDLIICQSVLQYLPDAAFRQAIGNFAKMCRGAVYLEIPTKKDWAENVDQSRTDGQVFLRTASWYRRVLGESFIDAGGGLFVARKAPVVFYELEVRS